MLGGMRLDIDSLRTFKTVVELGGITRAAQKLNLTQSAVSHKLARLEERIGRPLLIKGSGGLGPTADGRNLLSYADRLVSLHDEAAEHFRSSDLAGQVRLGSTEDATGKKFAAVLGRFKRLHPQVSLSIKVGQSLMLQHWLKSGEVDLAILQTFEDEMEDGDQELWREDLCWVQGEDHPILPEQSIPFVSFDQNCFYRQAAQRRLAEQGRSLNVILECPSSEGVRAGVRHGLGIALLGRRNLAPGIVEIHGDLPRFSPVVHVLRGRNETPSRLEKGLIEAVVAEMCDIK
ncbi:LysR family transcriptional regulator [Dongia soli]|uniref:LysR family transcriptional regulator n=1 Tax=Dongia soli TaxID=600628 RepID=A0ABU5EBL9_9PROT|nr:LysR family transcriptional regulator [Dongia soli]MDY0883395.1 LysR family transcriptional regulator [Dongia soli]